VKIPGHLGVSSAMNYSKWDKLAAEIDDDEDDQPHGARVTRLDQPSRVSRAVHADP
jgi:hypothetical protein